MNIFLSISGSVVVIVAPIVCVFFFCVRSLYCYAVLCVHSSFTIISLGKRELVALLYGCLLGVM